MSKAVTSDERRATSQKRVDTRGAAWLTAVAGVLLSSLAHAAEQAKPFAAPQAADPVASTSAGGLAQVTLSLLLVLAAVFAAAWAMRRLRSFSQRGAGAITILADIGLGAKERAVLIQVGRQQLLVGVTPSQVNTLHVLDEHIAVERETALTAPGGKLDALRPEFKAILKRSLGL